MDRSSWRDRYVGVRAQSLELAAPLTAEDQQIQSMPDVSPTKWHLAHVTWFFETFLLGPRLEGYRPFDPAYAYLFNSYYEQVGERHPRPRRGLLSRPSLDQVHAYREHVDRAMERLIETASPGDFAAIEPLLELGLNHEQQHQELILMDIKHVLSCNPLLPAYRAGPSSPPGGSPPEGREGGSRAQAGGLQPPSPASPVLPPRGGDHAPALEWRDFDGGLVEIGHDGRGFAFDNEGPRHKAWLEPYRLASRLSSCGEYLAFMEDGGYRRPELWLSDGWATVLAEGWTSPLYWKADDGGWSIFTLAGARAVDPHEPVSHLSFYEADAFARWAGARLPSESEWEIAAASCAHPADKNLVGLGLFHPRPAVGACLQQMIGDLWEWTMSPYTAYPRYRPPEGAVGEYNGKFMSGQMVLRGGAAVTPDDHIRIGYRNFFPPAARWAFSGVRLAADA
jgi:formylglycine-generating enzyme required for sulfatase activity